MDDKFDNNINKDNGKSAKYYLIVIIAIETIALAIVGVIFFLVFNAKNKEEKKEEVSIGNDCNSIYTSMDVSVEHIVNNL